MKILLLPNIKYYFSFKTNLLLLKYGNYIVALKLPSYYFYFSGKVNFDSLIFENKFFYLSFLGQINLFSKIFSTIYVLKLRMRGLVIVCAGFQVLYVAFFLLQLIIFIFMSQMILFLFLRKDECYF